MPFMSLQGTTHLNLRLDPHHPLVPSAVDSGLGGQADSDEEYPPALEPAKQDLRKIANSIQHLTTANALVMCIESGDSE